MSLLAELEHFSLSARGFSSDSRDVAPTDVFVALRGGAKDGHDFVENVLQKGAFGVVVEKTWVIPTHLKNSKILVVESSSEAHRLLAQIFRKRFSGKVIAVGGSSGKTSTKDFLASILSERFKVLKTEKSQNGELGIPKTLEKLRFAPEIAVIEVGIDAPGDMARHVQIVNPDIALLTSIGEEHLNLLGNIETVFREESILFEHTLHLGGTCYAPGADAWLRKFEGRPGVILVPSDPTLMSAPLAKTLKQKLPNDYAIQNATLAFSVAKSLGLKESEVLAAADKLSLPEGRGNVETLSSETVLIADHYNSNPSSLRAGLASAEQMARRANKKLVLILGDMLDLGTASAEAHLKLFDEIRQVKFSKLIFVGPEWKKAMLARNLSDCEWYENSQVAAQTLKGVSFAQSVILLKGSRGMALEHVLKELKSV